MTLINIAKFKGNSVHLITLDIQYIVIKIHSKLQNISLITPNCSKENIIYISSKCVCRYFTKIELQFNCQCYFLFSNAKNIIKLGLQNNLYCIVH